MSADVFIVGAGPVGMTVASELARYGVSVRIVDKAPQRTDKSKALVVWSRTLELLDRGPGGAAPFIDAGHKALAVNIVANDGQLMARVTMDSVKSPYPYGLMLPQSETERLLEERLASLEVTVERQVEREAGAAARNRWICTVRMHVIQIGARLDGETKLLEAAAPFGQPVFVGRQIPGNNERSPRRLLREDSAAP